MKNSGRCLIWIMLLVVLPLLILVGLVAYASRGLWRSDEDVLNKYHPSAETAEIAEKINMTDSGKAVFYRSDPQIVDVEIFKKTCFVKGIELALGCKAAARGKGPFAPPQIYLLKIDDPEFSGHKYLAAVHETLHIIYSRLSSEDKKSLNILLEQEFSKRQDDPHLTGIVDILKKAGKNYLDELHSVFGLEYNNLSPELEEHYKKYFKDRAKLVQMYQNGALEKRIRRIDQLTYDAKIINSKLIEMSNQLKAYEKSGNIEKYNNLVPQFNNLASQYNAKSAEATRIYGEVQTFYSYFSPNYKPPTEKK